MYYLEFSCFLIICRINMYFASSCYYDVEKEVISHFRNYVPIELVSK